MASTGFIGYGLVVEYDAPGGDFTTPEGTIPQTQGFRGLGPEIDDVEITNDESPNRQKEFIAGLADNGSAEIPIIVPTGGTELVTLLGLQGLQKEWRFTLNDGGTTLTFPGYVRRAPIDSATQEATTMTLEIKVGGAITPVAPT